MGKSWFVTGTDTEIGKTMATVTLLRNASALGKLTAGYKPVASGCEQGVEGLRNGDALSLQQASSVNLAYEEVNPYPLRHSTAPHIASQMEHRPIELSRLSAGLAILRAKAEWIFVEGAGGWFTPLNEQSSFPDWVIQEKLPVILVVGMKLGCLNHALLTAQAIRASNLSLVGWIANDIQAPGEFHQSYLKTLVKYLNCPFLGEIPFLTTQMSSKQMPFAQLDVSLLG